MKYLYFFLVLISFLVSFFLTPWVIGYMRRIGVVVRDMNKKDETLLPLSGGFAVFVGIFIGIMFIIFVLTFVYNSVKNLIFLLAAMCSIFVITFVGFIDDLLIKENRKASYGLKQWQKPLLTLGAAVPLMAVRAGASTMFLPFFGKVDLGLIYPLVFIPVVVVFLANVVNMLEGLNGVASGMGVVYSFMLGVYAYVNDRQVAAVIAFACFGGLLAFYFYNKYPAKILPGDSLTYLLGAILACIAILGNMERAVFIVSVPFFVEFFLKARSKFRAQSYGYFKDGKIFSRYKKIYSIIHFFSRTGRFTEKQIVCFVILIEVFFSSLIWIV